MKLRQLGGILWVVACAAQAYAGDERGYRLETQGSHAERGAFRAEITVVEWTETGLDDAPIAREWFEVEQPPPLSAQDVHEQFGFIVLLKDSRSS